MAAVRYEGRRRGWFTDSAGRKEKALLNLVNARTRQTLWPTDQLRAAGMQRFINGAEGYQRGGGLHLFRDERDEWLMSHSFRRFGQYAAAQVLQTLPNR